MKKKDLISVILCAYNVGPYIEESLNSVINQTYKKLEIILIDDGSTDNTSKICDEYAKKDKRIKVFHQENKGIAKTRNIGLKQATGEYIIFVDPDDYAELNYIEELYKTIKEKKVNMVVCNFRRKKGDIYEIELDDIKEKEYYHIDLIKTLRDHALAKSVIWNKLCHKSIYKDIDFECANTTTYEDRAIIYHLYHNAGKVYYLDKILYTYRVRDKSISHFTPHNEIYDIFYKVDKVVEQFCLEHGYLDTYIEIYVERMYLTLQMYVVDKKRKPKYKEIYLKDYKEIKKYLSKKRLLFFKLCKIIPSIYYWKVRILDGIDYRNILNQGI